MRFRVDELAARADVSVDTVRFYQARGLLDPPERSGRVGWYSDAHLERLRRIRALKDQGFSLTSIARLVDGALEPADAALVAAVFEQSADASASPEALTLDELAQATEVSPALIAAVVREGLLGGAERTSFTQRDVRLIRSGLALLESGLPLSELLALARRHDELVRGIAGEAVDLFVRYVRDGVLAASSSDEEAAARLVRAFDDMLETSTTLIAEHFRTVLLDEAKARAEVRL